MIRWSLNLWNSGFSLKKRYWAFYNFPASLFDEFDTRFALGIMMDVVEEVKDPRGDLPYWKACWGISAIGTSSRLISGHCQTTGHCLSGEDPGVQWVYYKDLWFAEDMGIPSFVGGGNKWLHLHYVEKITKLKWRDCYSWTFGAEVENVYTAVWWVWLGPIPDHSGNNEEGVFVLRSVDRALALTLDTLGAQIHASWISWDPCLCKPGKAKVLGRGYRL